MVNGINGLRPYRLASGLASIYRGPQKVTEIVLTALPDGSNSESFCRYIRKAKSITVRCAESGVDEHG
jgi:hypothetical protein